MFEKQASLKSERSTVPDSADLPRVEISRVILEGWEEHEEKKDFDSELIDLEDCWSDRMMSVIDQSEVIVESPWKQEEFVPAEK